MEIRKIQNKEVWEKFLMDIDEKTFLQSWNWGEFQKMMRNEIWRLGIYSNGDLVAVCLVIKIAAKRGQFLFAPHGPVLQSRANNPKRKIQILNILIIKLKEIAKAENCSFIRVAPIWQRIGENESVFQALGFKQAPIHIHPELTWQLNLEKSEKELLMAMRKTTRYLIRKGLKDKNLKIEKSENLNYVQIFNSLYQETARRHHFTPFSLEYLKNEFKTFIKDSQISIFLAKYKQEYIAGAIIIYWQGIGFYHQGASLRKYEKIPGSYVLQWEAIKEAKIRDCRLYNFWGIADVESDEQLKNHPWAGLTLFKKGFGGYENAYVKTQDLALSWKYWPCYLVEKARKVKRGL